MNGTLYGDFGNSALKIGWYRAGKWQVMAWPSIAAMRAGLQAVLKGKAVGTLVYASVLGPARTRRLLQSAALRKATCLAAPDLFGACLESRYDPRKAGADRLALAAACVARGRLPAVLVDAGSALTVDFVDAGGVFLGGYIGAGCDMEWKALYRETALLGQVGEGRVALSKRIPVRTRDAMEQGVLHIQGHGIAGLIDSQTRRLGWKKPVVFLTGGRAGLMKAFLPGALHAPHLVMEGLRYLEGQASRFR